MLTRVRIPSPSSVKEADRASDRGTGPERSARGHPSPSFIILVFCSFQITSQFHVLPSSIEDTEKLDVRPFRQVDDSQFSAAVGEPYPEEDEPFVLDPLESIRVLFDEEELPLEEPFCLRAEPFDLLEEEL